MDFSEVYDVYKDDIAVAALGQRVLGLDYDDVVSEMSVCLWQAHQTWDEDRGVTFGSYWWSLWLNRKAKLIGYVKANKRGRLVPVPDVYLDDVRCDAVLPEPPRGAGVIDKKVWTCLCLGMTPKDVVDVTGMSRSGYYRVIGRLRTEEVRKILSDI